MTEDRTDLMVTENWVKNYEYKLTDFYFKLLEELRLTTQNPTLDNLKIAFSNIKSFTYGTLYSSWYLKKMGEDVKPKLEKLELALFGSQDNEDVILVRQEYGVEVTTDRYGKSVVSNAQKLLNEMWEIFFVIKQQAYQQGFFAKQPRERKFGTGAIEAVMEM